MIEHDHIVTIYHASAKIAAYRVHRDADAAAVNRWKDGSGREGKLPLKDALRIGREIAEALAVAHGRGLIHRDIKPSNIWLEAGKGRVKLLDFGLPAGRRRFESDTDRARLSARPRTCALEQAAAAA